MQNRPAPDPLPGIRRTPSHPATEITEFHKPPASRAAAGNPGIPGNAPRTVGPKPPPPPIPKSVTKTTVDCPSSISEPSAAQPVNLDPVAAQPKHNEVHSDDLARPGAVPPPRALAPWDSVWLAESPIDLLHERARLPHPLKHPIRFVFWSVHSLFGIATLILLLAAVAAIPIVNFVALGYLLEAEGRVARSGKFRDAFPLIYLAPRFGSIALGITLCLLPLMFLSNQAAAARLIDPGAGPDRMLHVLLMFFSALMAIHICLALARGGKLSCFFRPIKNTRWLLGQLRQGGYWERAERGVQDFVAGLRIKYHFWLGLRGFVGGMAWLFIPTLFFSAANKTQGGPIIITVIGGFLLAFVLSFLPFLQARFAAENRLRAMFDFWSVRRLFKHAPLCWLIAIVVTYALSLPLYLSTAVLPPRDAMWLVTVIFIVSIYPARILVGWAYYHASTRPKPTWFGLRWLCNWVMMPLLGFYTFLLFLTQFIGAHGKLVLFEHHALLLPVPF